MPSSIPTLEREKREYSFSVVFTEVPDRSSIVGAWIRVAVKIMVHNTPPPPPSREWKQVDISSPVGLGEAGG